MGRRPKTYTIVQKIKGFRPGHEPPPVQSTPLTYKCTRCQRWKMASKMAYDRRRGSHNHLSSWCKDCRQEYMKEYRQTHKEQILTQQRVAYRRRKRAKFNENE